MALCGILLSKALRLGGGTSAARTESDTYSKSRQCIAAKADRGFGRLGPRHSGQREAAMAVATATGLSLRRCVFSDFHSSQTITSSES